MKIVYIGLKEQKGDNVASTGLVWKRGEIHEVADDKKAAKLLEHTSIWADAGKKYELIKEPEAPKAAPRVHIAPEKKDDPFWDPIVMVVPEDVFDRLQKKELVACFMTPDDADAYAEWKLDKATDPGPKETGPTPQGKKAGLETKKAA